MSNQRPIDRPGNVRLTTAATRPTDGTALELVLQEQFFRMIEQSFKPEEYRDIKPFWWKRIFTSPFPEPLPDEGWYNGRHKYVRFRLGYQRNAPTMVWRLGRQGIGKANPDWAMGHMGVVIKLELLTRIS